MTSVPPNLHPSFLLLSGSRDRQEQLVCLLSVVPQCSAPCLPGLASPRTVRSCSDFSISPRSRQLDSSIFRRTLRTVTVAPPKQPNKCGRCHTSRQPLMLRRSHKKSRAGCLECKRRHVKVLPFLLVSPSLISVPCPSCVFYVLSLHNLKDLSHLD